jgi:DNA-binding NtrC family response regulator
MGLVKVFTILVADRNSHVRELIKREMTAEGYRIRLAGNGHQVIQQAYQHEPIDLLIMDPDLPDTDASFLLKKIQNRIPYLPMVIHAFGSDYGNHTPFLKAAAFVEKGANSVEILKTVAYEILRNPNPQRTEAQKGNDQHAEEP